MILVVQGDPHLRQVTVRALQELGHHALEASCAELALSRLSARSTDIALVCTDTRMLGDMDGVELAFTIRSRWAHVGLIIISDYSDLKVSRLPFGSSFITQPYRLQDFAMLVSRQLFSSCNEK